MKMANYLENESRRKSLTDEDIRELIESFKKDLCQHCGADHGLNWYGGKRYKPLSNYAEGSSPIGHCCLKRFDDWIILIDLNRKDKRVTDEQLKECH
jgi:hypothetical protein